MKTKKINLLDQEYVPNAAAEARQRERDRLANWREQAGEREAKARRIAAEEARRAAEPITDAEELAQSVARLASAFGLKRRKR